jgi:tetratricopeptide (TPR) repeat protein
MERAKYKIAILFILFSIAPLKGSYRSEIYSAYIKNNMQLWRSVIDRMNTPGIKDTGYLLELLNYQYGYIAWCIGNNKNDEAKKYLDLAEKNITFLPEDNHYQSIVNAYKSAFYGYRMGINRLLVTFLGLKSINCAKKAISLDKSNPFAYIQYANIDFYMPAVFGGSKSDALKNYLHAEELMENDRQDLIENWNYLSLLTVIAQAYAYLNDYQSSKLYYEKILKIEPVFTWVKNELYPEVIKKLKNK